MSTPSVASLFVREKMNLQKRAGGGEGGGGGGGGGGVDKIAM